MTGRKPRILIQFHKSNPYSAIIAEWLHKSVSTPGHNPPSGENWHSLERLTRAYGLLNEMHDYAHELLNEWRWKPGETEEDTEQYERLVEFIEELKEVLA